MADPLRLAIVDNYPIFRDGVVQVLRRHKNILVVAEGATAKEAEQFAGNKRIDMLLLEVAVPGSLRAAQAIMRAHPTVKVVFLASTEDEEHATQALRAGAHGYIMKGITGPDLIKAIKAVHSGERFISSDLAWRLVTKPAPPPGQLADTGKPLSLREQQVLDHTSKGLTNQEIASVLGLAVSTIKYYKTLAFKKMGVRNRVEAIFAVNKIAREN
jgi:DNA-binding NarL/FixJ family response regulator